MTAAGTHAQLARAQSSYDALLPPNDDGPIAPPPSDIAQIRLGGITWVCAADQDGLYAARIDGQWLDITYALGDRLAADLWRAWQDMED